ncbi:SLC13 family permease [Psychrobium sp. 1_MG-2023]|uniref:SLC13 family permease n=1 Tax=Psychrobium sp. 1_MG-2023 TaxID=3062624 RepID=UPI000C3457D9|nr:SLC13 family permease [Psychrobium sp. 1_MG-2023]MDP2560091.1 SLC13 family permease [Psychrobium sp. 1_MG-2023]PKF56429.1 SLC13 family permease [Alteromonadales bacterium alter-6D02]
MLTVLVGLLISNKIRPAILFVSAIALSYMLDWISLEDMMANFTNSSVLTLVLLLLVSVAMEKTDILQTIGRQLNQTSFVLVIAKLGFSTAFLSSITNNSAVVASMIGVLKRNQYHSPSKLLLPLSYAAILGGTLTLIGTSTNLIVNSFVVDAGLEPIGFFDFTIIGLVVVAAGVAVLALLGGRLPDRFNNQPTELPYLLEAVVSDDSVMIGKTVEKNRLRALQRLYLVEIERGGELIRPVCPQEELQAGDRLMFAGDTDSLHLLQEMQGLEWFAKSHLKGQALMEVIVSHSASIKGKTLKECEFRQNFDAAVVAIRRGHEQLSGGLGQIKLRAGDTLMLVPGKNFHQHRNMVREFVMVSESRVSAKLDAKQSKFVLFSFLSVLGLALTGTVDLTKGLLCLLVGYLFAGVISLEELKRRFPIELTLIVGSALGLASIMVDNGVAEMLGQGLLTLFGDWGILGAFIAIYLFTLLLTELITNNAAAALAFPIAYSLAVGYGVDPRPFIMAVIFGASASFISPYGYQTNLMVYSAGNYHFKDYLRIGVPLSLVYSAIVIYMVPMIFPFSKVTF